MEQKAFELKDVISHAKEYGFVFNSSEIYDGLGAVYDYGQNGVLLKNNIKQLWWQTMTQVYDNIVGLDAAIFMHPSTWKASGHVDAFNDPMVDNRDSKKRYRADTLIEDKIAELQSQAKAEEADKILKEMVRYMESNDLAALRELLVSAKITCPVSGTANWTEVRQFNLMFSTQVGSLAEESDTIYLRPETAQGIFVNFLNVQKSGRQKVPFGIAQIGKAFRNEIVARQFIFRMREFEQMEMQFFVRPGTEIEFYQKWRNDRMNWHKAIGLDPAKLRYHDHDKLAHYANAAVDVEYEFPFGFKEMEGIHSRTDFDLKSHQELSGKKQQYFDPEVNKNYIPYVVETSVGADRLFLAVLCEGLKEEIGHDAEGNEKVRKVFKVHPALAPVKAAVLPLVKKDGLPEIAHRLYSDLKLDFNTVYEERDTIGKRYTRHDLIGTPYCIAIDYETPNDQAVTVRDRDTGLQERLPLDNVKEYIGKKTSLKNILSQLT